MTQLLLFESTSQTHTSAAMAAAAVDYARTANRAAKVAPVTAASANPSAAPAKPYEAGVNHMGDLARLVLMRYDLMAERRRKKRG